MVFESELLLVIGLVEALLLQPRDIGLRHGHLADVVPLITVLRPGIPFLMGS
jgi:hypothetical protein